MYYISAWVFMAFMCCCSNILGLNQPPSLNICEKRTVTFNETIDINTPGYAGNDANVDITCWCLISWNPYGVGINVAVSQEVWTFGDYFFSCWGYLILKTLMFNVDLVDKKEFCLSDTPSGDLLDTQDSTNLLLEYTRQHTILGKTGRFLLNIVVDPPETNVIVSCETGNAPPDAPVFPSPTTQFSSTSTTGSNSVGYPNPNNPQSAADTDNGRTGLGTGAIVGIAVGIAAAVICLVVLIIVVVFVISRKKKEKTNLQNGVNQQNSSTMTSQDVGSQAHNQYELGTVGPVYVISNTGTQTGQLQHHDQDGTYAVINDQQMIATTRLNKNLQSFYADMDKSKTNSKNTLGYEIPGSRQTSEAVKNTTNTGKIVPPTLPKTRPIEQAKADNKHGNVPEKQEISDRVNTYEVEKPVEPKEGSDYEAYISSMRLGAARKSNYDVLCFN